MPLPVQTPGPSSQLQRDFGLQGRVRLQIDETVVPVRLIADRPRAYFSGAVGISAGGVGIRTEIALVNTFAAQQVEADDVLIHATEFWSATAQRIDVVMPSAPGIAGFSNVTSEGPVSPPWGSPRSAFQSKNTAAATAGTVIYRVNTVSAAAEESLYRVWPFPLQVPGRVSGRQRSLIFRPNLDDRDLTIALLWSEPLT